MRFGFLLKRGKPEARDLASELIAMLQQRGHASFISDGESGGLLGATMVDEATLAASGDALVVLGGDGTFLYGAGLVAARRVPIFGVNLGSLGFITHFHRAEAVVRLQAAASGDLPIDERMRLRVLVRASGTGQVLETRGAVNDAVISQPAMARLLDLEALLDGEVITTYKADGLIVSTPTGSTAYNLAAGGPILTPDLEAIVLTPIRPPTLTNRPVVMRADAKVVVTNVSAQAVTLTLDGRWSRDLAPGDSIEVRKTERPLRMFRSQTGFFAVLRGKLAWGERHPETSSGLRR